MFSSSKGNKKVEFSLESVDKHAIPYACHYDHKSLLTKDGELMQVIKIEGYSKEMMGSDDQLDLRAIIRQAIMDNVKDRKVAIWFHTIRRKRNLDSINYFSSVFAKDTHDAWAKKNYWRDKFVNELYITILYEGEVCNHQSLSLVPKLLKKFHLDKLAANSQKLDDIVIKMMEVLKVYGGKRLEVVHDSSGAHSEILEFLTKIICLHTRRVAIPIKSIDNIFADSKIAFGGNALEVFDGDKKHFAAIFSIKEYHEFAAKSLDKFMGISSEYIISQTLNFVDSKEAKKVFSYFDYILGVSKDKDLRDDSGLTGTMKGDNGKQTDYGTQQMNLMIIGDSLEELDGAVSSAVKELDNLGIVIVREDLNIELCFWSQLPGNFKFFRRSSYINTGRSASFASLNNNPSGNMSNIWGPALTLFRRADGGPHFFNFHFDNVGHTTIVGPVESSKKILLNFLLSESSKYKPDILYIDQLPTSRVLVKALEGRHEIISLEKEKPSFSFNPFQMPDTPENNQFLKDWILFLIFPEGIYEESQKQLIFDSLDKFFAQSPAGSRQISMLAESLEDETLMKNLLLWCKPNKLGILFDNSMDEFDNGIKIIGLNIGELVDSNVVASEAVVMYCLYKYSIINNTLPQSPTIIAIDDANLLLQGEYFTDMLPKWLDNLTINNAMAVFMCDIGNEISPNIINIDNKISTHLFLPSINYTPYREPFNLTKEEVRSFKKMKIIHRNFVIKQKSEKVMVELNLDGLDYTIATLSGGKSAVEAMDKAISENGDNPNVWIMPFYKNLFPQWH